MQSLYGKPPCMHFAPAGGWANPNCTCLQKRPGSQHKLHERGPCAHASARQRNRPAVCGSALTPQLGYLARIWCPWLAPPKGKRGAFAQKASSRSRRTGVLRRLKSQQRIIWRSVGAPERAGSAVSAGIRRGANPVPDPVQRAHQRESDAMQAPVAHSGPHVKLFHKPAAVQGSSARGSCPEAACVWAQDAGRTQWPCVQRPI